MRINELISELNTHGQFGTYKEMMDWLVARAEEMNWKNRNSMSRDREIIALLKALTNKVGYRCEFGEQGAPDHTRDDECWYCNRSICEKHCGRRIEINGTFFSICPADVPKIDEDELTRLAEDVAAEEKEEEEEQEGIRQHG